MKDRPYLERVLIRIWPTVRRIVNDTLFLIEKVLRSAARTVMEQIGKM